MSTTDIADYRRNLGSRVREYILEHRGMQHRAPGFRIDLTGKTEVLLPHPAVHWESIELSLQHGLCARKLSKESNWQALLEFRRPQEGIVDISDYTRYSCLLLADIDDAPEDITGFFAGQTEEPLTPLGVIIIDMDRLRSSQRHDREVYSGTGSISVYGPAGDEGRKIGLKAAEHIIEAIDENYARRSTYGIETIEISRTDSTTFPMMTEASIEMRFTIVVDLQEDHFWKTMY